MNSDSLEVTVSFFSFFYVSHTKLSMSAFEISTSFNIYKDIQEVSYKLRISLNPLIFQTYRKVYWKLGLTTAFRVAYFFSPAVRNIGIRRQRSTKSGPVHSSNVAQFWTFSNLNSSPLYLSQIRKTNLKRTKGMNINYDQKLQWRYFH